MTSFRMHAPIACIFGLPASTRRAKNPWRSGLNLTAANHVLHLDRWWNPSVENQATDRAYRRGR